MKTLIGVLLFISSATAGVFCQHENGSSNGSWQVAMSWDGTSRRTCNGATRPVYYRIVADAAWEAKSILDRRVDIQEVFNDVWRGDSIEFTSGQTFRFGHPDAPVIITSRPGTGYVTVTTTEYAKLPIHGTRITPAYKPVMATLEMGTKMSMFALAGGGPSPATHFIFRGLYFQPTTETASYPFKLTDGTDQTYPFLKIGGSPHNWYNSTTGNVNGDADFVNTRVRASTVGGNVAGQNRIDVVNATRLTPGTKILMGAINSNTWYTVDQVFAYPDVAVNAQYIATTTPLTTNATTNQAIYVPMDKAEYEPDRIVVQHCVFTNPKLRVDQAKMILLNSRHSIVRDNFFTGVLSIAQTRDTQIISGIESPGPHYIENNYIDGGSENLMYGGSQFSGIGGDPQNSSGMVSADIRYNFFSHIPERDYFGPWLLTQETGIVGQTRTYSGVSVPGLPPNSPRLVFVGRVVGKSSVVSLTFRAMNTGVVGTTEPDWPTTAAGLEIYDSDPARASYGQTWCNGQWNAGDGVCWKALNFMGSGTFPRPLIKNNFELKHGANVTVQYNVFDWFGSMKPHNVNQYAMVNFKTEGGTGTTNCLNGQPFPYCWIGETKNIQFINNVLRGHSGGILIAGNQTNVGIGEYGGTRNISIRGNLLIQTERPWDAQWPIYRPITIYLNRLINNGSYVPIPDVVVEKNTFYTPFVLPRGTFALGHMNSGHSSGTRVISGNIWSRGSTGSMAWQTGFGSDTPTDGGMVITDLFPRTVTNGGGGIWGKNIILGASTLGFPPDSVWTGCPTSAACITTTTATPNWNEVFVDPERGNFTLRDDHWGKRALPDGSDIGADTNELPEIRNLTVTPTDRRAYFQWSVTQPIAHIPCVVEVHTAPDLESTTWQGRPAGYAGELADMSRYAGGETDSSYWNVRSDRQRSITIGRANPLEPATPYYYRLHCGGDVRRGSFTTVERLEGTAEQTVSRFIQDGNTRSMRVEYGLSYDRNGETIADGGSATAKCSSQETCIVSFPGARGSVVYYRWSELDESGAVIRASDVATVVVQ